MPGLKIKKYSANSVFMCIAFTSFLYSSASAGEEYNINPGMWETISKMEMTGVPPEMAAMMKKEPKTEKTCIKDKNYDFNPDKQAQGCKVTTKRHSASKVSWEISCKNQGNETSGKGEVNFNGDSVSGWVDMNMSAGPAGPMKLHNTFESKRIGAC